MHLKCLDRIRNFPGLRRVQSHEERNDVNQPRSNTEKTDSDRGHWTGRFDFVLACLGTAVGLGNVWRFPYLCYKNGGGAFLIPYIVMIFLVGMPVFLVELTIGQYSAAGPLNLFSNISPMFKGLGYAMVISAASVAIYYNMIIAWTLFYFFDSFRSILQWQFCDHSFNTNDCFNEKDYRRCKDDNSTNVFFNRTCYNSTYSESNDIVDIPIKDRVSPPQEYFNLYVLNKSSGIHEMGNIEWQLALCLLAAWVVVIVCLIKGIKTSGRVVYFTATFPYIILLILFIQGLTLEGFQEGIKFYIIPNFSKLNDIKVWEDAAVQVFYSFSIGGGGMITYASYNRFKNNLIRDVLIIGIGDMLTSIFSGLVVFSMLGFMANQLGKNIEDVVESGSGLAFISYPEGISRMPGSVFWALLFFFMLFLLGIDSQFAMVETIITLIFDQFPKTRKRKPYVVIIVGVVLFLLGLPLATRGGVYLLEIMDTYAAGWPYLIVGLLECLVVTYVYGIKNFMSDLKMMTDWKPNWWIESHAIVIIGTLSPFLIGLILIIGWVNYQPLTLGDYEFPDWGNTIGFTLAAIPIACIPIGMVHEMFSKRWKRPFRKHAKKWISPTDDWHSNARENNDGTDEEFKSPQRQSTVKTNNFIQESHELQLPTTISHF